MSITVNSREYAWGDISINLGGAKLGGARGIDYSIKQDKEGLYGAGNVARSIGRGNISIEGTLKLLQSDLETLERSSRAAGARNVLDLRNLVMVITYENEKRERLTSIVNKMEFLEVTRSINQGDKFMEVSLPFIGLELITE